MAVVVVVVMVVVSPFISRAHARLGFKLFHATRMHRS
jgi:hypothetical protein